MRNKQKTILGFTLLELIIVMGLVAFLATMGISIFGNFNKRQNLNIANDNIHNSLAQAKSFALSHVVNSVSDSCDTNNVDPSLRGVLIGYEFEVLSSTSYTINEICQPSGGAPERFTPVINTLSLPPNVEFDSANTNTSIRFLVLTGGAAGSYWVQFHDMEDTNRARAIEVSIEGVIKDANPR